MTVNVNSVVTGAAYLPLGGGTMTGAIQFSDTIWPRPKTGVTLSALNVLDYYGRTDLALNTLRASPIWFAEKQTLDRIGVSIAGAGGAGANIRVGLYTDDGTGYPNALVAGGSTELDATVAASVLDTVSYQVSRGLYWLVSNHDDATIDLDCVTNQLRILSDLLGSYKSGYIIATAYGALPATFPGSASLSTLTPVPLYRVLSFP